MRNNTVEFRVAGSIELGLAPYMVSWKLTLDDANLNLLKLNNQLEFKAAIAVINNFQFFVCFWISILCFFVLIPTLCEQLNSSWQ